MKYALILLLLISGLHASAQSMKKYPIGKSGCFYYGFCEVELEEELSQDSSKIWRGACKVDSVIYDIICVQLSESLDDLEVAERVLIMYLDFLKNTFEVKNAAGYGKGHRLKNNENTRGVIDYWEWKDGDFGKIKAWTDGRFIGIMMASGKGDLNTNKIELFLDGFRSPGLE